MEETMNFKCGGENLEQIPESIMSIAGISFPQAHTDSIMMAQLSKAIRMHQNDALCRVPFCVTTEAESLGAVINLGDGKSGPRVQEYAFSSLDEMADITVLSFETGRIKTVLDSVAMLSKDGETVALTVEGPFTIIASLIDPVNFYKGIRNNRGTVDSILAVIEEGIVGYILEGIRRGARIISYGDPVGAMDIVGPKVYADVSGKSSYRILKRIEGELGSALVHICGKTTTAFTKLGFAEAKPVEFPAGGTYGEALLEILESQEGSRVIGHQCIKETPFALPNGIIWEIQLT